MVRNVNHIVELNKKDMTDIQKFDDSNLNSTEKRVFEKASQTSLTSENKGKVIQTIADTINGIIIDYGLNLPAEKEHVATRLYDVLYRNYPNLAISEIKEAFNLNLTGDLDFYFKKRANGTPDKEHFKTLSIEYVTKVLNAYKEYKREITKKSLKAIEGKKELSDAEKKEARDSTYAKLWNSFQKYRDNGDTKFEWFVPHIYIELLKEMQMPIEDKQVDKEKAAYEAVMQNENWQKQNKAIQDCFDEIIEQGIDLYDAMKRQYSKEFKTKRK